MSVSNGQPVNQATFNNAFVSRTVDTSTTGSVTIGGNVIKSVADALTANAGGGQSSALALTKDLNVIGTCASDNDSVKLPASVAGKAIFIMNNTAHIVAVFPLTGDQIDGLAANTSITIPAGQASMFVCRAAGQWVSQRLAPKDVVFPAAGTLATLAGTESLSGKSFSDSVTIAEVATPAAPSSGFGKVYFKSDHSLYQLSSTGVESKVGSGSGSSGINYAIASSINSSDAESGLGTWATYADGAASDPVDGTGGSPTGTLLQVSAQPERGSKSYQYNFGAQGNGVSLDFAIDNADKAKPISISFDYSVDSTIAEGDYRVWIYDKTNGVLIQPAPYKLPSGVVNGHYRFYANFQTASNSTSYRLIIHQAVASTADLKFDNVVIGPEQRMYGVPVTDWTAYTPVLTGFGTPTNVTFWSRRVGDSLQIRGYFTSGTATAVEARIGLGFQGVAGNVTAASSLPTISILGQAAESSAAANTVHVLGEASVGYVTLGVQAAGTGGLAKVNGSALLGVGQSLSVFAQIPITGWSSSLELSSSADTRVVTAQYSVGSTAVTAGAQINFSTLVYDSHGAATTGAGWKYTAPVPGYYDVVITGTSRPSGTGNSLILYKNNVSTTSILSWTVAGMNISGSTQIYLNAGDFIDLRADASITIVPGVLTISKRSGPSQIAASESVYEVWSGINAVTFTSNVAATAKYQTKEKSSHGAYDNTTGNFTAPTPGLYIFDAMYTAQNNAASSLVVDIGLTPSSGTSVLSRETRPAISGALESVKIVQGYYLLAGQTVSVLMRTIFSSTAAATYTADQTLHKLTIYKAGN